MPVLVRPGAARPARARDRRVRDVRVGVHEQQHAAGGPGSVVGPCLGRGAGRPGSPTPQQSYLREGVYMPDGGLFVSRACCGGDPPRNTSRLMWEVNADGLLTRQVAVGFATVDHTSLDVSADGRWLLYLAGNDLYVSPG